jgi:hypothetical protein
MSLVGAAGGLLIPDWGQRVFDMSPRITTATGVFPKQPLTPETFDEVLKKVYGNHILNMLNKQSLLFSEIRAPGEEIISRDGGFTYEIVKLYRKRPNDSF